MPDYGPESRQQASTTYYKKMTPGKLIKVPSQWKWDDESKTTMNISIRLVDLDLNLIWAGKG